MFARGVERPNILVVGRRELKACFPTHFPSRTRSRSHFVAVQRGLRNQPAAVGSPEAIPDSSECPLWGHKQTSTHVHVMSALPPKADMDQSALR